MSKAIEYLKGARLDFDQSFDWYAKRSARAAIRFAWSVDEAINSISADPGRFPSTYAGCRFASLRRYPFSIVFREEVDRVVIVAVAHAKRRPGYWRKRR
jgi:plasmid stabilization system protein ParE